MTDRIEERLDTALAELARDVAANTPRPGPDLIARVLADAGEITAARRPVEEPAPRAAGGRARPRLTEFLFGWQSGAIAAMAVALVIGLGIGMQIEATDMPVWQVEEEDTDFFTADTGFLPEDFL